MDSSRVKRTLLVGILCACAAPFVMGQAPARQTPAKQPTPIQEGSHKPDPEKFAMIEEYVEALANWRADQKLLAMGNKVLVQPSPPGRYQIVINPDARVDTFLIDTQTGKVWMKMKMVDAEDQPSAWVSLDRLDSESEVNEWYDRHRKIAKPASGPQ